eukprot:Pgem_evm2s664
MLCIRLKTEEASNTFKSLFEKCVKEAPEFTIKEKGKDEENDTKQEEKGDDKEVKVTPTPSSATFSLNQPTSDIAKEPMAPTIHPSRAVPSTETFSLNQPASDTTKGSTAPTTLFDNSTPSTGTFGSSAPSSGAFGVKSTPSSGSFGSSMSSGGPFGSSTPSGGFFGSSTPSGGAFGSIAPKNAGLGSFGSGFSEKSSETEPVKSLFNPSKAPTAAAATSTTTSTNEEAPDESDPNVTFEKVLDVKKVDTKSGEEDEEVLLDLRAKLYRYDQATSQFKERGIGSMKVLKHKENGKVRLLMRRDQLLKICANHYVTKDMELKPMANAKLSWIWNVAADFSDGAPNTEMLCIRLKTEEASNTFKSLFEKCVKEAPEFIIKEKGKDEENNTKQEEKVDDKEVKVTPTPTPTPTVHPSRAVPSTTFSLNQPTSDNAKVSTEEKPNTMFGSSAPAFGSLGSSAPATAPFSLGRFDIVL